jgi:hypothetical protein
MKVMNGQMKRQVKHKKYIPKDDATENRYKYP